MSNQPPPSTRPALGGKTAPLPLPAARQPAAFRERLAAYVIDWAILGLIIGVVVGPGLVALIDRLPRDVTVNGVRTSPEPGLGDLLVVAGGTLGLAIYTLTVAYLYRVELMFRSGQTPGKRIMRLRVEPRDPQVPLTRRRALERFIAESIFLAVPGLVLLDAGWRLIDRNHRQCLHEKWPETVVTKLAS